MWKYLHLALILLFTDVATNAQPVGSPKSAAPEVISQEPHEGIIAFVNNFNRGSLEGLEAAAGNVQGGTEDSTALGAILHVLKSQGNSIHVGIADARIITGGNTATATLKVVLRDSLLRTVIQSETIQLRRNEKTLEVDGVDITFIDWRIVPGAPEAIVASPQNSLVETMATYMAFPQRLLNLSLLKLARFNMEQVASGMKKFLADWEGEFVREYAGEPFFETQDGWRSNVSMYMPDETALQVPRSTTGETYQLNLQLVGKNISEVKHPTKTVIIYDGQDGRLNFRHDGLSIVLFVDGHIELVSRQQSSNVIWKP